MFFRKKSNEPQQSLEDEPIQLLDTLIPKTVNTLQGVMNLYKKKHHGEQVSTQEFIDLFRDITKDDLTTALKFLQLAQKKRISSLSQALNEQPSGLSKGTTLPQQTSAESALHVIQGMLKSVMSKHPVPADEMIKILHIQDTEVEKKFKKEYEQAIDELKLLKKSDPIDKSLYLWAKTGQVLFYGGIVVIILIILRKLYEFLVEITDAIRNAIARFIRPSGSRYYLSLLKFIKKRRKKSSRQYKQGGVSNNLWNRFFPGKSSDGGVIVNIDKRGADHKYHFENKSAKHNIDNNENESNESNESESNENESVIGHSDNDSDLNDFDLD